MYKKGENAMIVRTCIKGDDNYEAVCFFVNKIYKQRLKTDLNYFQDYYVYLLNNKEIIAALGFTVSTKENKLLICYFLEKDVIYSVTGIPLQY